MDLSVMDAKLRAIGVPADWRFSEETRERSRRATLNGRDGADLWVFAYGSLIWDPAFHFSEVRVARLPGFERRFCLRSVLGRGSPEAPGLMAGLDDGAGCTGLAFRVPVDLVKQETRIIWHREMLLHAYAPTFLAAGTDAGDIEALAFVVDHSAPHYLADLSFEETAQHMATGVGVFGSSLEYLENLTDHLGMLGIEDQHLIELRDRARELAAADG